MHGLHVADAIGQDSHMCDTPFMMLVHHNLLKYLVIQIVCSQSSKECIQKCKELFDVLPIFVQTIVNCIQLKLVPGALAKALVSLSV